ncbi:hypothetical protein KI387_026736, partial [Taxus chinensis]
HDTEGCKALQSVVNSLFEENDLLLEEEEEQVSPVILTTSEPKQSIQGPNSIDIIVDDLPPSQIDAIRIATRTQWYDNPSSSTAPRP